MKPLRSLPLLWATAVFVCAQPAFPGLRAFLTDAEWKRAGLDRLSPDEIGVIDAALIRRQVAAITSAPAPTPATPPAPAPKPKPTLAERFGLSRAAVETDWRTQPPLEARATAWLTVNRFTLDNGQVWEGVEAITFDLAGKEVVIEARPMESFALKLKSGSPSVRVRRVR